MSKSKSDPFRAAAERLSQSLSRSHECATHRQVEEDRRDFVECVVEEFAPLAAERAAMVEALRRIADTAKTNYLGAMHTIEQEARAALSPPSPVRRNP